MNVLIFKIVVGCCLVNVCFKRSFYLYFFELFYFFFDRVFEYKLVEEVVQVIQLGELMIFRNWGVFIIDNGY